MRIRALTSMVLVIAWIVPAGAKSCPAEEAAGHVHEAPAEAAPHSHAHADHDHGNAHDTAGAHSRPAQHTSSDDASCCKRGPEAPAVQLVLTEAQPRPKLSPAVIPTLLALTARPSSATGPLLRRQKPRPLPFSRTRRPLLI